MIRQIDETTAPQAGVFVCKINHETPMIAPASTAPNPIRRLIRETWFNTLGTTVTLAHRRQPPQPALTGFL
ncbi:MAG: hypothetical protein IPK16_14970 [Anaerolineales bacterium]|nr:hypothetical protein [Anaerolineales bacterium]